VDETRHDILDAVQKIGAKCLVIGSLTAFDMALAHIRHGKSTWSDLDDLKDRRFKFIRLYERDERPSVIVRRLKTVPQTIYRWIKDYLAGGQNRLKKAGRAGRKPRLNQQQLLVIDELFGSC
jgi:hypothetical protein